MTTTTTKTAKLLDLDNVSKSYGLLQALKGLTLECDTGSIGLLGPNGAGKSTLLKLMLGLLPFEGRAQVLGYDSRDQALDLRARVGYMPERDCYIPGMNAVELCAFAGELCGLPRPAAMQRAHAVLHYVGLEDKRYLRVETYSTGMKQRVKLAQALVHDPELLLLDEPTNGLDPQGREEMLALIKDLPDRRGCSILLSSHLLPDVEYICDRAILLHQGEMLFTGTIDELNSVIGVYYYARVIKTMVIDRSENESRIAIPWTSHVIVWIMLLPTVALPLFWNRLDRLTMDSIKLFLG